MHRNFEAKFYDNLKVPLNLKRHLHYRTENMDGNLLVLNNKKSLVMI